MENRAIWRTKWYLAFIFTIAVCRYGFTDEMNMPLNTVDAGNLIKYEFKALMSEDYGWGNGYILGSNINSLSTGFGRMGLLGAVYNISSIQVIPLNEWFSLPLFCAAATGIIHTYSLSAGSGFIVGNEYFTLAIMGGISLYLLAHPAERKYVFYENENTIIKFDYGIYPVLHTDEFPFLRYIRTIIGYLIPDEQNTKVNELKFDYLVKFVFNDLFGLEVLSLYTVSGLNNFMPEYDLSTTPHSIEKGNILGNTRYFEQGIYDMEKRKIYKTVTYGLRIGSERFFVDLNYLILDNFDDYLFGLNGFPSITLNFKNEEFTYDENYLAYFIRFNTLGNSPLILIPDIGAKLKIGPQLSLMAMYTAPLTFSFGIRMLLGGDW